MQVAGVGVGVGVFHVVYNEKVKAGTLNYIRLPKSDQIVTIRVMTIGISIRG